MVFKSLIARHVFAPEPILVYGMKRSGNHAFFGWLRAGAEVFHVNNPFLISTHFNNPDAYGFPVAYRSFMARYVASRVRQSGFRPVRPLISFEDFPASFEFFAGLRGARRIVVVRDPENLFASRIRKGFARKRFAYPTETGPVMDYAIATWLEHAETVLALEGARSSGTGVYYDRWLTDTGYREELAVRLGLSHCPPLPQERASEGEGSSFAGEALVDDAERAALMDRGGQLGDKERALLEQVMAAPGVRDMQHRLREAFSMQAVVA